MFPLICFPQIKPVLSPWTRHSSLRRDLTEAVRERDATSLERVKMEGSEDNAIENGHL